MSIPVARVPLMQHAIDTYASETEKTAAVWRNFGDGVLEWRPHARSMSVREVLKHQLLSERRFFAEFLGLPEPPAAAVLPDPAAGTAPTLAAHIARFRELAAPRVAWLADRDEAWWLGETRFFEVERQRVWIFWRRVLHSAHHRTQLTVYLRLLEQAVPSVYGPTADVTWEGASPTLTAEPSQP